MQTPDSAALCKEAHFMSLLELAFFLLYLLVSQYGLFLTKVCVLDLFCSCEAHLRRERRTQCRRSHKEHTLNMQQSICASRY